MQQLQQDLKKITKKKEKISTLVTDLKGKQDKAEQLEQDKKKQVKITSTIS